MMRTIGVAIAVPEPHGEYLRGRRRDYGDALADSVPTHITLVPPTEVDEAQHEQLETALRQVSAVMPAFTMTLRGTGTFRPVSPVVFVAVSEGISVTELLAQSIRQAVELPPARFPFHPHVTVAQDVDDTALDRAFEELADFRCSFTVEEITLYSHDTTSGWVPAQEFPLG